MILAPSRFGRKRVLIRSLIAIAIVAAVSLTARGTLRAEVRPPSPFDPVLGPCTIYDDLYEKLFLTEFDFELWAETYHTIAERIIESLLEPPPAVECLAPSAETMQEAPPDIALIARLLPPWRPSEGLFGILFEPDDVPVNRADIPAVAIELLRAYECALVEHGHVATAHLIHEYDDAQMLLDPAMDEDSESYTLKELAQDLTVRERSIGHERRIARETLKRALSLVGGLQLLAPLDAELECVQKASINTRNITGLVSDSASCLTRTWDADDPTRDLPASEK